VTSHAAAVRDRRLSWDGRAALSPRMRQMLGGASLAGMLVCGWLIALGGSPRRSFVVPASKRALPDSLSGPLGDVGLNITGAEFLLLLIAMCACYAGVLVWGPRAGARWALGTVVVLHVAFLIAPPLLSKDIFSYVDYARLGVLHGADPYVHGPAVAPHDPVFHFVGWRHVPSAYGPLFTLVSYPLALLGVAASLWSLKALAAVASLGCVALVWRCARLRGVDPLSAALFYGANPLLLVYGVGGGHNDLIMLVLVMAGVTLAATRRETLGAAAVVGSVMVKASAAVVAPFMLLGERRRRSVLAGLVAGAALLGLAALLAFRGDALRLFSILSTQQQLVSGDSVPAQLAQLFGLPGVTAPVRLASHLALAAVLVGLLVHIWRGGDWVAASGWALLASVVGSTWLLGWYAIWPAPLAAVGRSPRLRAATLGLLAYFVAMRWNILIGAG
jgi:hypothetical protein